jgi:hypothetical protein
LEKNILKEYTTKIKQLNEAFQNLETNELVPVVHGEKSYTVTNIKEVQENLKKQEFTISVCGQINAGKSSFLNYLLFNDKEVLPADDTPWTAKLTTVRYGEENHATVTYYSQQEWELLKGQKITDDDGSHTTYYDEFLKEDVNNATLVGYQVETFITPKNKIETGIALEDLREYVTKGGQKTPFVKQVDIKVKNELTKGVVFVDTPGINDKNELRSKVTEDWIKNSCAVIYLFYAGQALSTADYEFIDQHLSSVPTDKILFALTKADISEDYEGAKAFVERTLKEDEELKKRKFITANKSIYPISTLSALINYKQKNNLELNEDEEFHLERILDESPSFLTNNGFIEEFTDGLKSHLMTHTGKAIIDKATEFLFDIYKTNETSLKSDLKTTKEKLNDLELSDDELKKKINVLKQTQDKIERFKKQFKTNSQEEFVAKMKSNLKIKLQEIKKSGIHSLNESLEQCTNDSIKALRKYATHQTKESLVNISDKIHNSLLNELSVKEEINSLLETFSNTFEGILGNEIIVYDGALSCVVENPAAIVENIAYDQLSVEKLKETCGKNYGKLFNKSSVKDQIFIEIRIVFENHANMIIRKVLTNISNVIEDNINAVYNNVNTEVKKISSNANALLESSKGYEEEKNSLQAEIVKIQERLEFVKGNFEKVKACI